MAKGVTRQKRDVTAPDPHLLCSSPQPTPVILPPGLAPARESAIRIGAKKWVNGTVLHYCFIDGKTAPKWAWIEAQRAIVRNAAQTWMALGIGLSLVETKDVTEAEIRIGCLQGDGSWSLVGTDNLDSNNWNRGRTLNYGWDLTTDWGKATALHELGHALGFSHEHQSPNAGIVWNTDAVFAYFSGPPNSWPKPQIDQNIINKLDPSQVQGTAWDPLSIMEYPFNPGLIVSPKPYDVNGIPGNTVLSPNDKSAMKSWYPPLGNPSPIAVMQLARIDVAAGQQKDFSFTPDATRDYTISTVGQADSRVVVFEVRDKEPRHLVSDDDSGTDSNVALKSKLVKGRNYVIRVRLNFVSAPDGVGLLVY